MLVILVRNCLTCACGDVCGSPPDTAPTGLLIGVVQAYLVPIGIIFPLPFNGPLINSSPLQMETSCVSVTAGFGFTVILTVKGSPTQLPSVPEIGVTV